jgi:hypothetical protein
MLGIDHVGVQGHLCLWVPITLSQPLAWYLLLNEALSKWVSGGERA